MAKIRDYAITVLSTATASMACQMPTHVTGDLLVAFVNKDTASAFTTPGGWTAQRTVISAGAAGGVYLKRATSASETVTFALTIETCCAVVLAIKNINGSTVADAISADAASGADDVTLPISGVGVTPAHNNCLILHGLSTDGGRGFIALCPWINIFAGDAVANSLCVSYTQQKAAAAITAPDHWGSLEDDGRGVIIAIRDDGNADEFDAYIPLASGKHTQITPFDGITGTVDKGTYRAAASIIYTSINGKTVTGQLFATTGDTGFSPYRPTLRLNAVLSTTNLNHLELALTSTVSLAAKTGLVFGSYKNDGPKDLVETGLVSEGGVYFLLGSSSANWRAWVIGGNFSKTESQEARNNFLIEVNTSDTEYDSAGTISLSAVSDVVVGCAPVNGAPAINYDEVYLLDVLTLAGGSDISQFGFDDLTFVINQGSGLVPLVQQLGNAATYWCPIKFGGLDPIFINCRLKTFQFPQKSDATDYVDFHVSNGKIGFEFDGQDRGSGDVDILKFPNCIFSSSSPFYWRFASTHDAGATIDFSGAVVVNAVVTLRSTVTLPSVTFIDCTTFTQNGATLSDITFSNTKVTSASSANAALITDSTFTSSGTGHALEIGGTAADVTLAGLNFSGYAGTNGSTGNEAIYVNIASGTMTISIAGGGSTPSIRTAGATVTVINAVTVRVNVKDASALTVISGARVLLKATTGTTVTITRSGSTATVTHTAHGYLTGQKVVISGANQGEYNGVYTVTVTGANDYTYAVTGSPATPATGTITSYRVILDGTTNGSGIIETTVFPYISNLSVDGKARKATSAPFYKSSVLSGTITSAGFDLTSFLASDS